MTVEYGIQIRKERRLAMKDIEALNRFTQDTECLKPVLEWTNRVNIL